ncbi:MAG: hypothetical protein GY863_18675 [bacterium]|nr:hypothetical protein [bacterium]
MAYGLDLIQAQASQVLPYMRWLKDPSGWDLDLMGMTFPFYMDYSIWYIPFKWLGAVLPSMLVVHIYFLAQCTLEVFGLYFLASRMFPDKKPVFSWTVIILFTFCGALRHSLGSVAPFGWTVFPDTMTTSVLLFSMGYFFEKKLIPAVLIAAFSFNIHLSITLFYFISIGIVAIPMLREMPVKKIIYTGIGFIIITLPLIIGVLSNPNPPLTGDYNQWLEVVMKFSASHISPSKFGIAQYVPFFFWAALFIVGLKYIAKSEQIKIAVKLLITMGIILLVSGVLIDVFHEKYAITFSFFRASRFITLIAVSVSAALFFEFYDMCSCYRKILRTGGALFIAFFICLNIIVFHPAYRVYPDFVKNWIGKVEKQEGSSGINRSLLFQTLKQDRAYVESWKETQGWFKTNTSPGEMILTPYYIRGFRAFSERPMVFQFRDVPFIKYFYFMFDATKERADIIKVDFPFSDYDDITDLQVDLETLYRNYSIQDIRDIADRLSIKYIVTEKDHELDLQNLFVNDYFNIYAIDQ